jgi:hypothetical protein
MAVTAISSPPAAADVLAGVGYGRVDVTYSGSGYRNWTTSRQTNHVLSRLDVSQGVGTSVWTDHGYGASLPSTQGVAATWYNDSGTYHEIVTYVGTDGRLNIGTIVNSAPIVWYSYDAPAGKTLTGHIAVTAFLSGGNWNIALGATTTDSKLFRYVGLVSLNFAGSWTDSSAGLTFVPTQQLSASTSPNGAIASIFASHTPGNEALALVRWNGTWTTTNISKPSGKRACQTIASAQTSPSGLGGSELVVVACTSYLTVGEIYLATATAYNSTTFTWNTYSDPTLTPVQSVAAVAHQTSFIKQGNAIDVWATGLNDGHLFKGTSSGGAFSLVDEGLDPEAEFAYGTISGVPSGTTSRVFFVGAANSHYTLYERWGGNSTSAPQLYRAFGDESAAFNLGIGTYAEGKASTFNKRYVAGMVSRPGLGGVWPRTYLFYSGDDGLTISSPVLVTNAVAGLTYNYVSDATDVVTDTGTMYQFQIGVDIPTCVDQTPLHTAIYAVSTTPSTFPTLSTPIVLEQGSDNRDHPYADIEHRSGQSDMIHVAWWDVSGPTAGIRYSAFLEGSTTPTAVNLTAGGGAPPRVTASDSGTVIVYYASGSTSGGTYLCELNTARTACTAPGWQPLPPELNWSTPGPGSGGCTGVGVSGGNVCMRTEYPVSMAVSESGTKLYFCYHKVETNGPGADHDTREETDAFCSSATKDINTGIWTWNTTPIAVAGVTNDNHDQFFPEVATTRESGSYSTSGETVIISWYDRTDDPSNYLFKTKKTISADGLVTVQTPRDVLPAILSDPDTLPRHCFDSNVRFIGDYSAAEGDSVHLRTLSVTANQTGGSIQTFPYADFNSLGRWDK